MNILLADHQMIMPIVVSSVNGVIYLKLLFLHIYGVSFKDVDLMVVRPRRCEVLHYPNGRRPIVIQAFRVSNSTWLYSSTRVPVDTAIQSYHDSHRTARTFI